MMGLKIRILQHNYICTYSQNVYVFIISAEEKNLSSKYVKQVVCLMEEGY